MSKQTFEERCLLAEQCLPDAPYRAMLKKLHTEMLAKLAEQPAQQEPVAQWQKRHPHHWEGKWENTNEHDAKWWRDNSQGWEIRPLYTSPPAQRKPLTDEEIENIANSNLCIYSFARAIEAKLKEKNT